MFRRWRLILRYLPPYRRAIVWGVLALVASNLLGHAATPLLLRKTVNEIIAPLKQGSSIALNQVVLFGLLAVASELVAGIFSFVKRKSLVDTSRRAESDLRADLFRPPSGNAPPF